jgi:hypothetical protein
MVPLDVSNNRTFGGGINMRVFWLIIFVITLIYILVIFPISSSLYDTQEDWTIWQKIKHCLCFFLVTIIFFIAITALLYSTIGKTDIPIKAIKCEIGISNRLIDGKSNPIGAISVLNHQFGWNMPGVKSVETKPRANMADIANTLGLPETIAPQGAEHDD